MRRLIGGLDDTTDFQMTSNRRVTMAIDDFPSRDNNSRLATLAETAFTNAIAQVALFVLQKSDNKDYGSDFQIEVEGSGHMTNLRVHVQLKGTRSNANKDGSISISVKRANLNYLLANPHSIYVCYHAPTDRLLVRSVDDVYRYLERRGDEGRGQKSFTIRFLDTFDASYQSALHARTIASSLLRRDDRLKWVATPPDEFHSEVLSQIPSIDVPEFPNDALVVLQSLHNAGRDDVISKAFSQFVASIGEDDPRLIIAYLSEINLAMRGKAFDRERTRKAIEFIVATRHDNDPDSLYWRANAHNALDEREEAKRLYIEAIERSDGSAPDVEAQYWKNLGSVWESDGDHAEARQCYEQAISLSPQLMEAHMALAMAERDAGNIESALEHFERVVWSVDDVSSTISARGHRIELYFRIGMPDRAFEDIAAIMPHAHSHPWVLSWCAALVSTYTRTNDAVLMKSIHFWDAYLRIAPEDEDAREERLKCLAYGKMHGKPVEIAFSQYEAQVAAFVTDTQSASTAHLWDQVGHWAQIDRDWEQAEQYHRKAFDLEPEQYGYCLGVLLNTLKRFDEALSILEGQVSNYQPDASSWFQVALAREKTGDSVGCIAAYRRALELEPQYAAAMFNLGGVLWNSGDRHGGIATWSEALVNFPDDPLSIRLREQFSLLFDDV